MVLDREGSVVVIELDLSSSLVSVSLSAVRKLSSGTSDRNRWRTHSSSCSYMSIWQWGVVRTLASCLQLLNLLTTYQHWPHWPHSNILVVSLIHQGASATAVAASQLLANCTIWLTCNHINSHAILESNCIRYVLEGLIILYSASPRAITFLLKHNSCNYFPNCTWIHVVTYTNLMSQTFVFMSRKFTFFKFQQFGV